MKHWHSTAGLVARLSRVPLILLALGASAPLAGCVGDAENNVDSDLGTVGFELTVAPGVTLDAVTYLITGNGFEKTGTIDTSDSPIVSGTIGGIPTGSGYTITLTATSAEGDTTFTGSAKFNVTAGQTTSVTIHLNGASASHNGSVSVNGTLNVGPIIDELTATPLTVFVGGEVKLSGAATDPDGAPSALSYYWSTTGGVIDSPIAPSATLTSDTPGTFTISLTVSDGELATTKSTSIQFVEREAAGGTGDTGPDKPNILLIIADDLGSESVSLYPDLVGDSGAVSTPNIEELAENGLVFDNAWSSPACSMTRGTIVTGQYAHRTGVTYVNAVLPTDTVSIFDRITAESPSYGQALIGKYHLAGLDATAVQHVTALGVPYFHGIVFGGVSDFFNWTSYSSDAPPVASTTFTTTAFTDYALEYIEDHETKTPDQPWFVYQAYNAPHGVSLVPFQVLQVPPAELHSVDLSSVGNPPPGAIGANVPILKAQVQSLDTEIGRLLRDVDLEETTVVFVGDNGTPPTVKDTGAGVRGAKGSVYEGGVRVPLIVAGAGVTRRGREDDLVVTNDLFATILELTGIPASHVEDSYSIKPLLSDETAPSGRTHAFTETASADGKTQRYAVRDTRFKLVSNNKVRELYDLIADPLETTDLYSSGPHAAVRASLEAEIAALAPNAPAGYFP